MPKPDNTAQMDFDWLVPYGKLLLRPDEVQKCLGRERQHIYDLIGEGKLEAHGVTDRDKQRYTITRRSVVLRLAETALYDPSVYMTRVEALVDDLDAAQLLRLIQRATEARSRKALKS
ncbi:MAG: hypothetical protein ABIT76_08750 [Chthoniobacterales bacterium]